MPLKKAKALTYTPAPRLSGARVNLRPVVANAAAQAALQHEVTNNHLKEVLSILTDAPAPSYPGKSVTQRHLDLVHPVLNAVLDHWLRMMDWDGQRKMCELDPAFQGDTDSIDFTRKLPCGRYVAMEVQFGNAGRLAADFAKLRRLHEQGRLALGILVYLDCATAKTADSSLATYEKAVSRLAELQDVPTCVIGLSREGAEVVDLRDLKGIPFPTTFGGSGQDKRDLFVWAAEAINSRRPLVQLTLSPQHRAIVSSCSHAAVDKTLAVFHATLSRVLLCDDELMRQGLLHKMRAAALAFASQVSPTAPTAYVDPRTEA